MLKVILTVLKSLVKVAYVDPKDLWIQKYFYAPKTKQEKNELLQGVSYKTFHCKMKFSVNPFSANPTKWSNKVKKFVGNSPRIV